MCCVHMCVNVFVCMPGVGARSMPVCVCVCVRARRAARMLCNPTALDGDTRPHTRHTRHAQALAAATGRKDAAIKADYETSGDLGSVAAASRCVAWCVVCRVLGA
jgi:hypothetical protein